MQIIYEDENLLVISKQSGITVNNSTTSSDNTIQNMVIDYLGADVFSNLDQNIEINSEFVSRNGLAHRLDKDTSGVLLLAKDPETLHALLEQFKSREVYKEYIAIIHGILPEKLVEVDAPIKRNPKLKFRYAVVQDGKPAVTTFEHIEELNKENTIYSLIRALPKTGRTHQIRVHLSALGTPVAGDLLYSTRKQLEVSSVHYDRLMLHAHKLSIVHPKSGEKMTFVSPIPDNFS